MFSGSAEILASDLTKYLAQNVNTVNKRVADKPNEGISNGLFYKRVNSSWVKSILLN